LIRDSSDSSSMDKNDVNVIQKRSELPKITVADVARWDDVTQGEFQGVSSSTITVYRGAVDR
jgi:hypothetical protein